MKLTKYLISIASSFCLATMVSMASPIMAEGSHNEGFWTRTLLGTALTADLETKRQGKELNSAGTGLESFTPETDKYENALLQNWRMAFSAGYVVIPNLAVHGGLDIQFFGKLKHKKNKNLKGDANTASLSFNLLTAGITYYVMPLNFYVSPELRMYLFPSSSTRGGANYSYEGKYKADGLGYSLTIGKEWLLTDKYGLGVALSYVYDSFKNINKTEEELVNPVRIETSEDSETSYKTEAIQLLLSSTFN